VTWLVQLVGLLLRALLPQLAERMRPTAEDAAPSKAEAERLRTRVREHWSARAIVAWVLLSATAFAAIGCEPHMVYVPEGAPVRLRETVRDVRVWVRGADGRPVAGRMDLPEGWYALPMPEEE